MFPRLAYIGTLFCDEIYINVNSFVKAKKCVAVPNVHMTKFDKFVSP